MYQDGLTVSMGPDDARLLGNRADEYAESQPAGVLDGKYVLHRQLGQGGCGTVWQAEQLPPVKRSVAIKFLRADVATEFDRSRFALEHQALAVMSHPFIARVYDWGTTPDKRPYLVMEYVDGAPINRYSDLQRLTIDERLTLFLKLCDAVEHAHQRSIIHRDIKPSNVLVAPEQRTHVPRLIDFGLAKALPGSGYDAGLPMTNPGFTVGTPAYMSPEQIGGELGIDVRTDVYSLGILLYELICGSVPFASQQSANAGLANTFHLILNYEADSPRLRLKNSSLRDEIAAARSADWKTIVRSIQGDLESIILKAIEKQPGRRYQSVEAFRRDVECFLSHHPVEAKSSTRAYRFRKFLYRHRWMVTAVAATVLLLVVSTVGLAKSLYWARKAEADARLSLLAERRANMKSEKAMRALAESLVYVSQIDFDQGYPLLEQMTALHDIVSEDCDTHSPVAKSEVNRNDTESIRHALHVIAHLRNEQPELPSEAIENLEQRLRQRLGENDGGCSPDP